MAQPDDPVRVSIKTVVLQEDSKKKVVDQKENQDLIHDDVISKDRNHERSDS